MFLIFIENSVQIARKMRGIFWRNDCRVMHAEFLSDVFVAKLEEVQGIITSTWVFVVGECVNPFVPVLAPC